MKVSALLVARTLVVLALFPALAGCATTQEPLTRGDVARADPPVAMVPEWASPAEAEIHPGALLSTEARECPIHFVFYRPDNGAVFVGTTAYCVRELGVGSVASIGEAGHLALLVYSSAVTMAEIGEDDPDALEYNDLAVFHVDAASRRVVSPALPGGGPDALAEGKLALGERVRAFARAPGLPSETDWREGVVTGHAGDWALLTYTVLPGAPGTLGGGVVDTQGRAVGVLVTLGVVPHPGANGVARLDTMMEYAREHAKLYMELATA